jgi:pimeloyl-ACP methyl ester carboxylesterase
MSSWWSSTKKDDHDDEPPRGRGRGEAASDAHHEPNERTALLHEGYLDPDDPAVSPYNLFYIRFIRALTLFFFLVNFVWWTLLLVSIFVTPPGLHTRGSGFTDFSFVTLTSGMLLVTLLFFAEPSLAMRISAGIVALVLLVDTIIILAVGQLRREENPVGTVSVVWALFVAVWTIVTDRFVAAGKREEEVRLTGRAETRRTLKEWLAVLVATVILVVFILITVLMTGTIILRARDASLKPPGTRYSVDGDKYGVHLACVGNVSHTSSGTKRPTLLIEGGLDPVYGSLSNFADRAYDNGTISRYCFWDRPGYAWSDTAPSPHSAGMSSTALSEVLARAGEEGPWIVLGAGYGAIVTRIWASQHMHEVQGMLLVDPLHEDLLHRIGNAGLGFVLWGYGIISPLGLQRIPGALFKGRTREDRVYGVSAYQSGRLIKAHLQENLVADSLTKNEIVSAKTILGRDIPLAVVSSGIECGRDREWERKQEETSQMSNNLVGWTVVKGAPHEVWKTHKGAAAMEKALKKLVATKGK